MGAPSPSPDASEVTIGSVLDGRYRIDEVLGSGGMGRVYKGEHTGIGRTVAIKVLHAALGKSKEATARFQREALASGRLDHPNIVAVSDFGVLEDGSLYLVMEALEGESLGDRLKRDTRLGWLEAVEIVRGVLAGLHHAHDRGVVHRDIKPDNVFLAKKDGELVVKILDFGIAKLVAGDADDPASTRAGITVGTPAYLSPEQAVGGEIKAQSDLYSTSILLYEMLTGRPPFQDSDPLAMLTAHVSKDPPPFAEVAPTIDVPAGLEAVVRHGLEKVKDERIASAAEYAEALENVLRTAGYAVATPPRASGQVGIPTPIPGAMSAPVPGAMPTPAPGAMVTPVPGAMMTPVPGASPPTGTMEMAPSGATPVPGTLGRADPRFGTAPTATMPSGAAFPSYRGDPRRWIKVGVALLAAIVVAVIVVRAIGHHGNTPGSVPSVGSVPLPLAPGVDRETQLKAALHDLESGRTCAERHAAIPILVQLGDREAIPSLRRARYRMRGGVLGIGDSNTNGCLKADAEAAIKLLEAR